MYDNVVLHASARKSHYLTCTTVQDCCHRIPSQWSPTATFQGCGNTDIASWESVANDHDQWRHTVREGVKMGEEKRNLQLAEERNRRKQSQRNLASSQSSDYLQQVWRRLMTCQSWSSKPLLALFQTGLTMALPLSLKCLPLSLKDAYYSIHL